MLASQLFRRVVSTGTLKVIDAVGGTHVYGNGGAPRVTIRLHDRALHHRLLTNPKLVLGEAYMDGMLTVEGGTIYDLLDLAGRNLVAFERHPLQIAQTRLIRALRLIHTYNPVPRARRNVAHHYDLSDTLYDLFLDRDRQYSCAYFKTGNDSLEVAQDNKKLHLAAKLLLKPGQRVLDIGSGWGGLALYLARAGGVDVTGLTLSAEQHKVAQERARKAGLAECVRFHLRDYREEKGRYDRIVSVGMFEHVGTSHYRDFFAKVRNLLTEDGVAVLHSIGRMEEPGGANPWLRKYIFPGGYCPALSEVMQAVERVGLWVTDVEILRLHYAETLREWRRRFDSNRDRIRALYDERFCRMWEFYLAGSEVSFRHMRMMVFQMQLTRHQEAVPLTRDYITEFEQANAGRATLAA